LYGLNLEQETALTVAWMSQDKLPLDLTNLGLTHAFVALKSKGFLQMETDMGEELAFVQQVSPAGDEHYDKARKARRGFCTISDDADELMMLLAAEDKQKKERGEKRFVSANLPAVEEYSELSRNGLLDIQWAANAPFFVEVTDRGRSYSEGWFLNQLNSNSQPNIEISPTFNVSSRSDSYSSSSVGDITLGATIGAIIDLDIDEVTKEQSQHAVKELESAAKSGDKQGFAEKLEKVASIAKSSSELAPILLTFVKTALGILLGM
jgi:hypothetical protein